MAYQTKGEMAGYPSMGQSSVSSAYTPSVSSSQLYPTGQRPFTPQEPPPMGFIMATYPEDSRYPRRPVNYPITSSRMSLPTGVKYQPLKPQATGGKVMCLVVFSLFGIGIIIGVIMAIAFGLTWKSKWGYP